MSASDHDRLQDLAARLETIDLAKPTTSITAILQAMRELCAVDVIVCARPVERMAGWELERFECAGSRNDTRLRRLLMEYLATAPRRLGWFDGVTPEVEQRDVALVLDQLVPRAEAQRSELFQRVLAPLGLQDSTIERVLICEGNSLLAWYGVLHRDALTERQRELWLGLLPALRRRLGSDRQLADGPLHAAALETVLAQIGVPALIVTAYGRIREANPAARRLLEQRPADVEASLAAAQTGQAGALAFELTPLRPRGTDDEWLALLHARTPEARRARAVAIAAARLGLTRRQADVLEGILRGDSNQALAARLGVSTRAIEQHLSAMFTLANVDSRAGLVSMVLLAPW